MILLDRGPLFGQNGCRRRRTGSRGDRGMMSSPCPPWKGSCGGRNGVLGFGEGKVCVWDGVRKERYGVCCVLCASLMYVDE